MRFWVDVDNAPHVLVLRPIIAELERRGHQVEITAREYGQTIPLLELYGMHFKRIGRHWGKSRVGKYLSFLIRSAALTLYASQRKFDLAFCHGTRAVFLPAKLLRIPLVVLVDYEHTALPGLMARWITLQLFPDVIPNEIYARRRYRAQELCGYPGLKEDLYVHDISPDPSILQENAMDPRKVIVVIRPPATMAHYAVPESETLFYQILDFFGMCAEVQAILLPRTVRQKNEIDAYAKKRGISNLFVPNRVYEGPAILRCADLVLSGGGTMNREAAILGIPVFSIYQGPMGAVDRHLISIGRLRHLATIDVVRQIPLVKAQTGGREPDTKAGKRVRAFIVERIVECAARAGR